MPSTDYADFPKHLCVICGWLLRNGLLSFAEEIVETRIGAQLGEVWIDAHKSKPDGVLAFGLGQPAKRAVEVVEQRVDNRDFVGRHPVLGALGDDFLEDRACFVALANRREYVRALRVRGGRVAGKTAFLFKRGKRFSVHTF